MKRSNPPIDFNKNGSKHNNDIFHEASRSLQTARFVSEQNGPSFSFGSLVTMEKQQDKAYEHITGHYDDVLTGHKRWSRPYMHSV